MFGAIWGDVVGSPYEFDENNCKAKDFPWLTEKSRFTDDSVMSLAVADALLDAPEDADDACLRRRLIHSMQTIGRRYPDCGYGPRFRLWVHSDDPRPYQSYGNGSAMRVAPVAWLCSDLERVRHVARCTAQVSHDHPEGIRGAEAVAAAVFLARTDRDKTEIRDYVEREFGYDLHRTCDAIRPGYHMDVSCQGSVPEAIIAFLESTDFEDAIRTAVSLGGDSDTLGAIAGSIAEGFYGLTEQQKTEILGYLTPDLRKIAERYAQEVERRGQ